MDIKKIEKMSLAIVVVVVFVAIVSSSEEQTEREALTVAYSCNFDSTDSEYCAGVLSKNGSYPLVGVESRLPVYNPVYLITDVTSIYEMTKDGKKCIIPYMDDSSTVFYHCSDKNDLLVCFTDPDYSECSNGKFLTTRPAFKNEPYLVELSLPLIGNLTIGNTYIVRYYILFDCNAADCTEAQDFISVRVFDGIDTNVKIQSQDHFLSNVPFRRQWIKQEMKFTSFSQSIKVLIQMGRKKVFREHTNLGFDNIELIQLNNIPTTTRPPEVTNSPDKPKKLSTVTIILIVIGSLLVIPIAYGLVRLIRYFKRPIIPEPVR